MSEETGEAVYGYSSEGQIIPLEMGQDAELTAGMKVIAEGTVFAGVTEEDFKYTVTGYGLGTSICRSGNLDAWVDFENGGE